MKCDTAVYYILVSAEWSCWIEKEMRTDTDQPGRVLSPSDGKSSQKFSIHFTKKLPSVYEYKNIIQFYKNMHIYWMTNNEAHWKVPFLFLNLLSFPLNFVNSTGFTFIHLFFKFISIFWYVKTKLWVSFSWAFWDRK